MSKLNFLFLLLLYLFVHHPKPVHPQISSPYGMTYPWDLANPLRIDDYFQNELYDMGWTKVFYDKDKVRFSCMTPTNDIDLCSIIYRTSEKKGVVFHFQPGSLENLAALQYILKAVDRPSNFYVLPVHATDESDKGSVVDYASFLNIGKLKANVAFGFVEKPATVLDGYKKADLDGLSKQMDPQCRDRDTPHYIALNAYRLSNADAELLTSFNYYKHFRRCKLLLYLPPGSPALNVTKVRKLTTDQINFVRTRLVLPGRSLPIRFYSLHNVAWWYCMGHEWSDKLGENGLLRLHNSGATLLRVPVYPFTNPKHFPNTWVLRPMIEEDIYRVNFSLDLVYYVDQLTDKTALLVIRPYRPQFFPVVQNNFFEPRRIPFYEALVMVRPKAQSFNQSDIDEFWKTCEKTDVKGYKFLFSYIEGTNDLYTNDDVQALLQSMSRSYFSDTKMGVILEMNYMSSNVSWQQVADVKNFQYVFLKSEYGAVSDEMLADMAVWVQQFQNQIIVLMFDEHDTKVNTVFQYFTRHEPEDTSNWSDDKETTLVPPPPTTPTTPTTARVVVVTTTEAPEPTPGNDGGKQNPNSSTRIHCWGIGVMMVIAGIVGVW